jgi:hypothetical protein
MDCLDFFLLFPDSVLQHKYNEIVKILHTDITSDIFYTLSAKKYVVSSVLSLINTSSWTASYTQREKDSAYLISLS